MQAEIYIVDARKTGKDSADNSLPFQRFYLIPGAEENLHKFRGLTPYSVIVPLTEAYESVLNERGVPFEALYKSGYKVMVPLHTEIDKEHSSEVKLTYLTNKNWRASLTQLPLFLPDTDTTLLTPKDVISPVCLSCNQHLQHITGDCTLGSQTCLEQVRVQFTATDLGKLDARQTEAFIHGSAEVAGN